jgi:hypothetical protein
MLSGQPKPSPLSSVGEHRLQQGNDGDQEGEQNPRRTSAMAKAAPALAQ